MKWRVGHERQGLKVDALVIASKQSTLLGQAQDARVLVCLRQSEGGAVEREEVFDLSTGLCHVIQVLDLEGEPFVGSYDDILKDVFGLQLPDVGLTSCDQCFREDDMRVLSLDEAVEDFDVWHG